ncbi:hypothetical protein LC612_18980 [Nostoc sp. CHAB 5834]|nr:hypothetical protein [Nostoc sp. CHAB 5834]
MITEIRRKVQFLLRVWRSAYKLKALSSLPTELKVTHTPNPVQAHRGGLNGYQYTWVYATTIQSLVGAVVIEEFGAFSWVGGQWYFTNFTAKPFTRNDFIEWYSGPRGMILPNCQYTDFQNWSGSTKLINKKTKWYFIGRNQSGKHIKGEAEIEELGELIE